jgi:predicted ABC-type sugar transport system permease subunit
MKGLSQGSNLRLGIILTATGIIAIAAALLRPTHHLSPPVAITIGVVLLVAGIPFLLRALQYTKRTK